MHCSLKYIGLGVLVFMLSACGNNVQTNSDKIAVVKWEKAVESHPEYPRLVQGEKIVKNLILRRDAQAEIGKSQMGSLQRLRGLKKISEQSYMQAELQTQLLEKEQKGKAKLFMKTKALEKEAEAVFAPVRKAVEDEYRLRIFNLRLEKDRALANTRRSELNKLQERLAEIDKKIQLLIQERESQLVGVDLDKQEYIAQRIAPERESLKAEMEQFAKARTAENLDALANDEGKYNKMMSAAPEALAKALAVMDREIDKQQDKNKTLKKKINDDIESVAIKLAKERRYTIVFNTFKANVSADDITNDIITNLKKINNK